MQKPPTREPVNKGFHKPSTIAQDGMNKPPQPTQMVKPTQPPPKPAPLPKK